MLTLILQQSRLEQSTYKVSGRMIGEPAILSARIGGDLLLRLTRIPRQEEPPIILYARVNRDGSVEIPNVPPGTYRLEATPAAAALRTQQVREADGFPDMRISKSGKLTVSLTCESSSPGSRRLPRHANQHVREAGVSRKIWILR